MESYCCHTRIKHEEQNYAIGYEGGDLNDVSQFLSSDPLFHFSLCVPFFFFVFLSHTIMLLQWKSPQEEFPPKCVQLKSFFVLYLLFTGCSCLEYTMKLLSLGFNWKLLPFSDVIYWFTRLPINDSIRFFLQFHPCLYRFFSTHSKKESWRVIERDYSNSSNIQHKVA